MSEKVEKLPKTFKVSSELKDKLEKLFEDFPTQEAFLEHVVALYEMQQLKEGTPGYAKQLDELDYHTRRINELYLAMIQTETAARLELTQEHDEKLADRAATITLQEQEIQQLKQEAAKLSNEIERIQKEHADQVKLNAQLEEINRKDNLLVEQYKDRNDTLTGLVNEYKAAADENKELHIQLQEKDRELEAQTAKLMEAETKLAAIEKEREDERRKLVEQHKENMDRLTERLQLEKERELVALRSEYQLKSEKASEEATTTIRSLYAEIAALQKKLQEANQPKSK
jgi:colicin import membrane protein